MQEAPRICAARYKEKEHFNISLGSFPLCVAFCRSLARPRAKGKNLGEGNRGKLKPLGGATTRKADFAIAPSCPYGCLHGFFQLFRPRRDGKQIFQPGVLNLGRDQTASFQMAWISRRNLKNINDL